MHLAHSNGQTGSSDDAPLNQAPALVATITRMRLRHCWYLIPAIRKFHDLYRHAADNPAFIRGHFSVVDPWTTMNVSIWSDRSAMLLWGGTTRHVSYVRWAYGHCREIWSSEWQLNALSRGAALWDGPLPFVTDHATDEYRVN